MVLGAQDQPPRRGDDPRFLDAVTFSFGDPDGPVCGVAGLGLGGDPATAGGLGILFSGSELAATRSQGGIEVPEGELGWDAISAAGVTCLSDDDGQGWSVAFETEDGAGFDLRFDPVAGAVAYEAGLSISSTGGVQVHEQLCHVTGDVRVQGGRRDVDCLGQRGRLSGIPDWERLGLVRQASAWWGQDLALALTALRPAGASTQDAEELRAFLIEGSPAAVAEVAEPRLSTTYDATGHQRRAGLELWPTAESEFPRRAAGEAVCAASLALGDLRLECAFFAWRMEGRAGIGRYDVLRRP